MILKDIPGYEGLYMVSTCGEVISLARTVRSAGRNIKKKQKILLKNTCRNGYKIVTLYKNGVPKTLKIHRLVCLAFIGESDLQVNHKDFNRANNNLDNLEYVTALENNTHRNTRKHTHKKYCGPNHHCYKISEADRVEIFKMKKTGVSAEQISKIFKVHKHTVYKVINRYKSDFPSILSTNGNTNASN